MITAKSLTNGTLTVIIDNGAEILTARNDHPKWTEIVDAFKSENDVRLQSLISLKAVVETYSVGKLSLNSTGVTYGGSAMHGVDSNRVLAFLRDGLPFKPLANYLARKMANPSARAIQEMYNFLEHKNMPLTDNGTIIAYKGVRDDFYSVQGNTKTVVKQGEKDSSGHILNNIGATIEVERSSVDDDFRNGCSFGLHAGSLSYAKGWGKRVILVEIDPADVVSIPDDCSCQKLRCCKYKVIGEYTGPLPDTYTNEFSAEKSDAPSNTSTKNDVDIDTKIKRLADISNRCKAIVAEQFGIDIVQIHDSSLLNELGADSLDGIELVMALEEEFQKEIGDNEAEALSLKPFSCLVDYIYTQLYPTPTIILTVDSNPDFDFFSGQKDGAQDRASGVFPRYLANDQFAADSPRHKLYIEGYVDGYATD